MQLSRVIAASPSASVWTLSPAALNAWNSITTTKARSNPKSEATTPSIWDETSASNPSRVAGTKRRTARTESRTIPTTTPTTSEHEQGGRNGVDDRPHRAP